MGLLDIFKNKKSFQPRTAIQRKLETEKYLKSIGIQINEHLPLIEEEHEVQIRTAQEITKRILILTYLNYFKDVPESKKNVIEFLKSQQLWNSVSDTEHKYFDNELSEQDEINISWRTEAIWLLLWTIRKVENLELPKEQVIVDEILDKLPDFMSDCNEFIEQSEIRTKSEILDISDLIYRLHWATRENELKRRKPLLVDSSIVEERHYAINWVTYHEDNWDDITTDT
jgi:hypothetical protein